MLRRKLRSAHCQRHNVPGTKLYQKIVCPITIPKVLTVDNLSKFLMQIEFIFGERLYYPILVNFPRHIKPNRITFLLVYMFFKITCDKNIAPGYYFSGANDSFELMKKDGFYQLCSAYVNRNNVELDEGLINLEKNEDNLYIFPQHLKKSTVDSAEKAIQNFLNKIQKFYIKYNNISAFELIASCVSEIISNSWAHSGNPEESIVFADGNKDYFHLCICDIGLGIISNLSKVLKKEDSICLQKCLANGVSSKIENYNSFHMGRGLYIVRKIVTTHSGSMNIWSEGYHVYARGNDIKVKTSGYWMGTIIDIVFNTDHTLSIREVMENKYESNC